jgi:hypothetical protein
LANCPAKRPTRTTGFLHSEDEYETHLQHDLQTVRDDIRPALIEAFGAVAALKNEAFPFRGLGDERSETVDLPRSHERRHRTEVLENGIEVHAWSS